MPITLHLVDGTYELFRHFYGAPPKKSPEGREVGATLGLLRSLHVLLTASGATHVAYAFDTVVESFRNELYAGYKTGEGIDPDLWSQFPLAEEAVAAMGVTVWPMHEFEADDALASGAARSAGDRRVGRIVICSPDKDLAQMVAGKVVCWDRRRNIVLDETGVVQKFGVSPASIPDFLGLVGDAADGYPGIPGWGAKSASAVLSKFKHLEAIPENPESWGMPVRGSARLAQNLSEHKDEAFLFRKLATLRTDVPLKESLDDLEWQGARRTLTEFCRACGDETLPERITRWRERG